MRIKNRHQALCSLFRVKFLRQRVPLALRWQLTNRCVCRCKYCNIWCTPEQEMTLDQIVCFLDEMAALGTQTISFSGGEPMLRKDIGQILEETAKRGISTEMNSTGAGIPRRIKELKHLHFLKISLDGPEEIHDSVRGKNAFRIAMAAAEAAKTNNLKFAFSTTLTKYNIQELDFILGIAQKFSTFVAVQPMMKFYRGISDVDELEPSGADYKAAIQKLIDYKKKGGSHLRNSLIGLEHIYSRPRYPRLPCWAGKVFCILNTDGTLVPCDRIAYNGVIPNVLHSGFRNAFYSLPAVACGGCGFCGVLELNFILAFKFGTIKSLLGVIK